MSNNGVLRHLNISFTEAALQIEEIGFVATNSEMELTSILNSLQASYDLVLVDSAEAPCLAGLHEPDKGIFTILTDGFLLTIRFAIALQSIVARLQVAQFSGRKVAIICDFGNEVNCFSSFISFLSDVKRLQVIYPNFVFVVVDNSNCGGLMRHAVEVKKRNLVAS